MHAINLVPQSFRHEQTRTARMRGWAVIFAVTLLVSSIPVARLMLSRAETARLASVSTGVQAELLDLQRQCQLASSQRDELTSQAILLAAPVGASNVPEALARIAAQAPIGVMLTRVVLQKPVPEVNLAPSTKTKNAAQPSAAMPGRVFLIEGFAADHSVVVAFTEVVKATPACRAVQLVRSQRTEHALGELQAFTLECDWENGT